MAHTSVNTADIQGVLTTWLNQNFVSDLEYLLQHQKFTTKAIIPKNSGKIGRFLTFAAPTFAASYSGLGATALTEGTTTQHEITQISQTSTDITIAEYGEFTKISSLYEYAAVPGLRQELLKRLRDGAAFSIDRIVLLQAVKSTNILYAAMTQQGGATTDTTAMTAVMGAATITLATKTLFAALARGFTTAEGVPNGQFAAVITPDQEQDIITEYTTQRMSWNQSVVNVPGVLGQQKWVDGYIGSVYRTAVVVTQNYTTHLITTSQEIAIVYADGGCGAMAFQDMQPEIIINDVNSPYKNINSAAWHVLFGAGNIDTNRIVKIYSAT